MPLPDYARELALDPDTDRAARAVQLAWVCSCETLELAWPLIEQASRDWAALGLALDCASTCQNSGCVQALEALLFRRDLANELAGLGTKSSTQSL